MVKASVEIVYVNNLRKVLLLYTTQNVIHSNEVHVGRGGGGGPFGFSIGYECTARNPDGLDLPQ